MSDFCYSPMFPISVDETEYKKISDSYVKTLKINGSEILLVKPKALTLLSQFAFKDVSHLLRKSHLSVNLSVPCEQEALVNARSMSKFVKNEHM